MIAGVVLAGGRSRRFGRDKALALLCGQPLIRHSLQALHAADVLAISGPKSLAAAMALPAVADRAGVAPGPLAGVLGALEWAASANCAYLLTAPCDTPFLPQDLAARLSQTLGDEDAPVAAARAERPHPLCALWRTEDRGRLLAIAKATGERQLSLSALIGRLGGAWSDFPHEADFANLNTESDLEAAERLSS